VRLLLRVLAANGTPEGRALTLQNNDACKEILDTFLLKKVFKFLKTWHLMWRELRRPKEHSRNS